MNKNEMKTLIDAVNGDKKFLEKCEKAYGVFPDEVKKILSNNDDNDFIGGWRVVSESEVLNPEETVHVDFKKKSLIPVADMMDNNFICYDLKNKVWTLFNMVDKVRLDTRKEIYDYLKH